MAATITYLQKTDDGVDRSTYTFAAVNFGTASSDRIMIVGVFGKKSTATCTINSVTIGGVTASVVGSVLGTNSLQRVALYAAAVPSGTSGNVVVFFSATQQACSIVTYATTGVASVTPSDSNANTSILGTYDLDVPAGGIAVAICENDDGTMTATWAGLTENFDSEEAFGFDVSGASSAFATTQTNLTVSCTWSGTPSRSMFVVASFASIVSGPTNLKSYNTNLKANIKSINTNLIANVKSLDTNV